MYIQPILISCWFWILFRKLLHMGVTSMKHYIAEASTWIGFSQIALVPWAFSFLRDEETAQDPWMNMQLYAMSISWLALIFELGNIWLPLFTFVTVIVKIIKKLIPFMFTTVLITIMFAHTFRVVHTDQQCLDTLDQNSSFIYEDGWTTCSVWQSYLNAFIMFFTRADWNFVDKLGVTVIYTVVSIFLLNITIAVMVTSIQELQNDANTVFWNHRLSLSREIESLWFIFPPSKGCFQGFQDDAICNDDKRVSFLGELPQKEIAGDLQVFFDWWFSPKAWVSSRPSISMRLLVFYKYSLLEDIIYPGEVFDRVLLGLKKNQDPFEESRHGSWMMLSIAMAKVFSWYLFICYILVMLICFVCGLVSFGILWPKAMKEQLFHVRKEHEISNTKEQKEELRRDNYILFKELRKEIETMKKVQKKNNTWFEM